MEISRMAFCSSLGKKWLGIENLISATKLCISNSLATTINFFVRCDSKRFVMSQLGHPAARKMTDPATDVYIYWLISSNCDHNAVLGGSKGKSIRSEYMSSRQNDVTAMNIPQAQTHTGQTTNFNLRMPTHQILDKDKHNYKKADTRSQLIIRGDFDEIGFGFFNGWDIRQAKRIQHFMAVQAQHLIFHRIAVILLNVRFQVRHQRPHLKQLGLLFSIR